MANRIQTNIIIQPKEMSDDELKEIERYLKENKEPLTYDQLKKMGILPLPSVFSSGIFQLANIKKETELAMGQEQNTVGLLTIVADLTSSPSDLKQE